jgi:hypothetical protein
LSVIDRVQALFLARSKVGILLPVAMLSLDYVVKTTESDPNFSEGAKRQLEMMIGSLTRLR